MEILKTQCFSLHERFVSSVWNSEVKLSMASLLSDRIVDDILESLSRSQHTLVSVLLFLSVFLSDCFLSIHPFLLLLLSVSRPTIWSGSLSLCCTTSPTWRRRFWMRWSCSQRTTTGTRNMSWRKWTPAWWETCSTHYCWNKNSKAVTSPPSWNFYFVKESKSCFSSSDDS